MPVIEVAPERLIRWCTGFGERHGGVVATHSGRQRWTLVAGDGTHALIEPAFPPVEVSPAERSGLSIDELVAHCMADRTVGVFLVRLGAHAAGVFDGTRLVRAKVGRARVHGRASAGGWSQRRFARRREAQARDSLVAAADVAVRILVPDVDRLDAVVLGGDRRAMDRLRGDRRLVPVFSRAVDRFLTVPEPRLVVLRDTPRLFRAARITL